MSKFNKENALAIKEITEFQGIDTRFPADGEGKTREMFNYRILKDGSIKRRSGMKFVTSFDGDIRAIWTGYVKDEFLGYAIANKKVYKLNYDDNGEYLSSTHIGNINTNSGDADIFYYRDQFFIIDGVRIYSIANDYVRDAQAYVPHYAKDWPTGDVGEVYEPLNILTNRARMSYVVTDPPNIFLCTKNSVDVVHKVLVNGVPLNSSDYEIDDYLKTINIPLMSPGDKIDVILTFKSTNNDAKNIMSSTRATVFGGMNNSRIFMWNKNSNDLYASTHVSEEELKILNEVYGNEGILYFTSNSDIRVGDGNKCIQGVSRHYDRLLVFTESETWMADSSYCDNEEVPIMRINSQSGASCEGGITRCLNDPISVDRGRILRWQSNTDELDDCNAYCISDKINEIIPDDFFDDAIAIEDKRNGEVLFAKKNDIEGIIYVYQEDKNNWYTFGNIPAAGFYEGKKNIGVYIDNRLFVFDDSLEYDIDRLGTSLSIKSYLSTYPIDFGLPYDKKRLRNINLLADTNGEALKLELNTDNGMSESISVSASDSEYVSTYNRRLNSGRFTRASMYLEGSKKTNQRIYRIAIAVKH